MATFEVRIETVRRGEKTYVLPSEDDLSILTAGTKEQADGLKAEGKEKEAKALEERTEKYVQRFRGMHADGKFGEHRVITYMVKEPTWDDVSQAREVARYWQDGRPFFNEDRLQEELVARCIVSRDPEPLNIPSEPERRKEVVKGLPPLHVNRVYQAINASIASPADELPFLLLQSTRS